jgi:hypothetical protein
MPGGSGVVIIAYEDTKSNLTSITGTLTPTSLTPDTTSRPGYKVYTFTGGTGTVSW